MADSDRVEPKTMEFFETDEGRRDVRWLAILACLSTAIGCTKGPVEEEFEREIDYFPSPDGAGAPVRARLLDDLAEADNQIKAAISEPAMTDTLAGTLVDAHDRGVDVRIVADVDAKSAQPFQVLEKAGVPVVYGDGQLQYLPNPNLAQIANSCEMKKKRRVVVCRQQQGSSPCESGGSTSTAPAVCRPSSFNYMSHTFFAIDEQTLWNLAGRTGAGTVAWRAESEVFHEDFLREFRQLAGGVFATNLDTYNGPNKSRTDDQVVYRTDEGKMNLRFNPQERLMKHVVDEAYAAKSSVRIVTPSLTNPFLLDALEYKANNGFEVEILVGNAQPEKGPARARLAELGARQIDAGRELPSIVLIDSQKKDGEQWPRQAMALSHALWHAQPSANRPPPEDTTVPEPANRVIVFPSDQFVDGNMWKLYETSANSGEVEEIDELESLADRLFRNASPFEQ
ncbi:MAG: hypothetical protein ABEL76_16775 [Bradymonadaceae bacterium]